MSYKLMQDCCDMVADIDSTAHAVLMVLCRFAHDDGTQCYPSTAEICRCSRFAVRPVRAAITRLADGGWITYSQQPGCRREFSVNASKISSAVVLDYQHLGIDQQGGADQHGGIDQRGDADQQGDPDHISTPTPITSAGGTPVTSAPRKEHIRSQLKEQEEITAVAPASPAPAKKRPGGASKTMLLKEAVSDDLPDTWRDYCLGARPDLNPDQIWTEFVFHWTVGKGKDTRRSIAGWASTWQGWVRRQKATNNNHNGYQRKKREDKGWGDIDSYTYEDYHEGLF